MSFEGPKGDSVTERTSPSWWWAYGLVVAVGAVAGFAFLGRSSFFLDETVSTTLADASWRRFAQVVTHREVNMALYYVILRGWVHVGQSEVAVRSLSVLASLGALAIIVLVARRLFGGRAGLICGLLFAVDPLVVEFAQDARGYALSVLLVIAASLAFVKGVKTGGGWVTWATYVITSALAAYVNLWAAFVPLGFAASLFFLPKGTFPWRRFVVTFGSLVVVLAPLGVLIHLTDEAKENWASGSAAGRLFSDVRDHVPHLVIDFLAIGAVVIVAGMVLLLKRLVPWTTEFDNWPVMFTVCWLVVPVGALVLLSFAYEPLFVLRYLVVYFPPLIMVVAFGLSRLNARSLLVGLVLLTVASGAGLWSWYSTGFGENWRGAVAYVADESKPGDGVMIFAPYMRIPFEWYLKQDPTAARRLHPVYPNLGWGVDPLRFDYPVLINQAVVASGASDDRRVWLVLSQAQLYPQQEQAVIQGLRSAGLVEQRSRTFAGVQVLSYAARSAIGDQRHEG